MATVRMPSSLHARKTRIAISPRFAQRTFLIGAIDIGGVLVSRWGVEDYSRASALVNGPPLQADWCPPVCKMSPFHPVNHNYEFYDHPKTRCVVMRTWRAHARACCLFVDCLELHLRRGAAE